MSIKENKLVITHVIKEFLGKGNLDSYDNFVDPGIKIHCPISWQKIHHAEIERVEQTKAIDQEYAKGFQFNRMQIHELVADGNIVAARWEGEGRQGGPFFSYSPTRRKFQIAGQTFYRLNKARIVEVWHSWDLIGLLDQVGISLDPQFELTDHLVHLSKRLSTREKECLRHLIEGKTAFETGLILFLSPRTIEYYFENLKDKLDCSNKRELFKIAKQLDHFKLLD